MIARLTRPEGLMAALDSRLAGVRRDVWARLGERDLIEATLRALLPRAQDRPEAALFVLEEGLDLEAPGAGDPEWTALYLGAFLDLLERPPRETHQKRALVLMTPTSALARRLLRAPVSEEAQDTFTLRLKRWQGTDRVRFPLLDFLRVGRSRRDRGGGRGASRPLGGQARESAWRWSPRIPTRAISWSRDARWPAWRKERSRTGMELKTTIPHAIQKARELGDLKENAEYHAAKDKQATYARRFEELETLLNRVRLIESLERPAGVAMPGTEVRLAAVDGNPDEAAIALWLLGDGDQALGDNVVSFRAPVGQAIFGRREGEEIDLPRETGTRRYRITRVEERLP